MSGVARSLVVSLAIGLAALALVTLWMGSDEWSALTHLELSSLAWALLALAVSFLAAGGRLMLFAQRVRARLGVHHAVRAHLLGQFASSVTPGGSGGLPALSLTLRHHAFPDGKAWACGVMVLASDAVFFTWATPLSLLVLQRAGLLPSGGAWGGLGWAATAVALTMSWLLVFRLRWSLPLASTLLRGPLARWRQRALDFLERLLDAQRHLRDATAGWHLAVQGCTAVTWAALFLVLVAVAAGLDLGLSWWAVAASLTVVTAIGMVVPTPGGSGFFELGASAMLVAHGGAAGTAAAVLIWRALTHYALYLIGPMLGGYLLMRRLQGSSE